MRLGLRPAEIARWWPPQRIATIFVAVFTSALVLYFTGPLNPDVSGQFWLARSMRHGARLYVDYVEINPPLWFWMALPIDWLAQTLKIRPQPLTILVIGLLVATTIRCAARLTPISDPKLLTGLLIYVAAILLIMPLQHLEQREHIVLVASIPYLLLVAARRRGLPVGTLMALAIGIGGALGFALKPYFLLAPILAELWLFVALRQSWRPVRPETFAMLAVGALYALAVLMFTPEYLTRTVPVLFSVYEAAAPPLSLSMDALPLIWACMAMGIAFNARAIRLGAAPVTVAFLLGFLGFALAYAIQHKGWLYQGLPATGCLAVSLAASLLEGGIPKNRVRAFIPALLLWPLAFPIAKTEMSIQLFNDIAPALGDLGDGDSFGLISTIGATTWPSTVDRGLRMSSRYGQYWMLASLNARPRDPTIRAVAEQAVRDTAHDFRCLPPKVIVFTRFDRRPRTPPAVDDPYRYFMRFEGFRDVISHYRLEKSYGIFDVYRQATAMTSIDPSSCRNPG